MLSRSALRSDALRSAAPGFALRVGLPWIRSMPLSSVRDVALAVDGEPVAGLEVDLGGRRVRPDLLARTSSWWYLQDRLVLVGDRTLAPGRHAVSVDLRLLVPYLQAAPGVPLVLPVHLEGDLVLDHPDVPSVSRDVA